MTHTRFKKLEYMAADCIQFEISLSGFALHDLTDGKICEGCPKYHGGTCKSLLKMIAARASTNSVFATKPITPSETVREEALRRNIGIKEVRRQRNATYNGEKE